MENYYQPKVRCLVGSKDIKALQLSYTLNEDTQGLDQHMRHLDAIKVLVDYIFLLRIAILDMGEYNQIVAEKHCRLPDTSKLQRLFLRPEAKHESRSMIEHN